MTTDLYCTLNLSFYLHRGIEIFNPLAGKLYGAKRHKESSELTRRTAKEPEEKPPTHKTTTTTHNTHTHPNTHNQTHQNAPKQTRSLAVSQHDSRKRLRHGHAKSQHPKSQRYIHCSLFAHSAPPLSLSILDAAHVGTQLTQGALFLAQSTDKKRTHSNLTHGETADSSSPFLTPHSSQGRWLSTNACSFGAASTARRRSCL